MTSLMGIQTSPSEDAYWKKESEWKQIGSHYEYSASSGTISKTCDKEPNSYLQLPQIIHAVHEVYLDKKLVYSSGDKTFDQASPFYQHPEISCRLLQNGTTITWKTYSYAKYFSRFKTFPTIQKTKPLAKFFDINLNNIAAGALFLLGFFSYYLFSRRIDKYTVNALSLGAIFFSLYFTMTISIDFSLPFSMLTAHKVADTSLLIGSSFYFYVFTTLKYFPAIQLQLTNILFSIFIFIIILSKNGDTVQLGTSLSFPVILCGLITVAYLSLKETIKNKHNKQAWLSFTSTMIIVLTAVSDVLHILGILEAYMILPIGAVTGVFLLALSANQQIEKTYNERDELLHSLETKVAEKTKDLSTALEDLKRSQADLVQSAKLASLGTLSAGVAHEINNSINFVNGAIAPLEKKVMKLIPENEKPSLEKLFAAIRHGTDLTVQIVRSLRSFTGLNQASFRDVSIKEIVESVATILKSKLNGIQFTQEIEESLSIQGSQVGLSQVVMNLVSNAIDVLPEKEGKITVKAYRQGDSICLDISDNGCGMSPEIRDRIFDPFFTTKDVGKGTGLGLFIVKKEVDRHQGKISVISELNQGTTFKIILPLTVKEEASYTDNRSAA
ncbi:MAG: sensor histidine kinase [Bdellovibrio sp.]